MLDLKCRTEISVGNGEDGEGKDEAKGGGGMHHEVKGMVVLSWWG